MNTSDHAPDKDPFPHIPCALLNSHHLWQYATLDTEGERLFEPFRAEKLKSASYEISFCGTAYWWDPDRSGRRDKELKDGVTLEIPRNSIVFIRPAVKLKVPGYLALRFNLHIALVHRGLLLGTGPLVDPGFEGHLLIPVHNLTDAPVFVNAADGFIWIEVTKVSPLPSLPGYYVRFPARKKNLEAWEYFQRANASNAIRSSLPSLDKSVSEGLARMRRFERRVTVAAIISLAFAIVGIGLTLFQFFESTKQLVVSTQQLVSDAVAQKEEEIGRLSDRVAAIEARVPLKAASASAGSSEKN